MDTNGSKDMDTITVGEWVEVEDAQALEQALGLARGSYQRDFLLGYENLSGSTLAGKAAQWGARYAESRATVLKRLSAAGIPWSERRGQRGRRILVLGA